MKHTVVIVGVAHVSELNHTKVLLKLATERVQRADITQLEGAMQEQERLMSKVKELNNLNNEPNNNELST